MKKIRTIARVDVKNAYAIKGIHLEGLRRVGDPNVLALNYYDQGADEIIFMDAVASYYDRNNLIDVIKKACADVFIPITVGGGIRNVEDIQDALNSGADKVAVNTQAIKNSEFLKEASHVFGSQCVVLSIEAKKVSDGRWEAYFDNGREPSGLDVVAWAQQAQELGVGEVLITSVDKEGTKKGFDCQLVQILSDVLTVPVIACGGAGRLEHFQDLVSATNADAVAISSMLHYDIATIPEIKQALIEAGAKVRL